jgi:hypothetical protein
MDRRRPGAMYPRGYDVGRRSHMSTTATIAIDNVTAR